jgi:hypothetical protein
MIFGKFTILTCLSTIKFADKIGNVAFLLAEMIISHFNFGE